MINSARLEVAAGLWRLCDRAGLAVWRDGEHMRVRCLGKGKLAQVRPAMETLKPLLLPYIGTEPYEFRSNDESEMRSAVAELVYFALIQRMTNKRKASP